MSFDLNAKMNLHDAYIKLTKEEQLRKYSVLSSHFIDSGKYYTVTSYGPETGWGNKREYSWDGKRSHSAMYEDRSSANYRIKEGDVDQILAMTVLEGLQFPYRIFFPLESQNPVLTPTPNNIKPNISADNLIDISKSWKVVKGENGFVLHCNIEDKHIYELHFSSSEMIYPKYMVYTDIPDGTKYKYTVKKWLDLSDVPALSACRYPEKFKVELFSLDGDLHVSKDIEVSNFKFGQKVAPDQFIIDTTDFRYFYDDDRGIMIDKHDNSMISLPE